MEFLVLFLTLFISWVVFSTLFLLSAHYAKLFSVRIVKKIESKKAKRHEEEEDYLND